MSRLTLIVFVPAVMLLSGLAGCVVEGPRRPVAVEPAYVRPAPAVVLRP
jgi:hypothetical protein